MKYIIYILFLIPSIIYGQYKLDNVIKNHPFFKTVDTLRQCSMHNVYYEQQDGYGINGARMDCYLLQEQIKDSLRTIFSDKELFGIAQYSRIPFFRIAAFELYSQTNYPKHKVIQFLKRGKMPGYYMYMSNDTTAETYYPPNHVWPVKGLVRLKMLEMIDPAAKQHSPYDSTGRLMADVPKYLKSKKLDLETFVSVDCYIKQYCMEQMFATNSWVEISPGQKPKTPTFHLPYPLLDFGTIDLNYLDSTKRHFKLRGAIKVINATSKPITLAGEASEHTKFAQATYVIPPKKEMMIEFTSRANLNQPHIERKIIIKNVTTGGTQVFKFKANFINIRTEK